jgi:putative thiazole-containing bacteriocin maturation protein
MFNLNPSMRLRVKRDTFFYPDRNGGVYFRNNVGSFHMEGESVDQWIEQLIPIFNGEHSLEDITNGLPEPSKERILEIAELLLLNRFLRDVSQDQVHQLTSEVLDRYASQIEFLDNLGGSGAYRFQCYRQAKVLVAGSGSLFVSLVAALLESGLAKFHVLITDLSSTNRVRLAELSAQARKIDSEVEIKEVKMEEGKAWRDFVQPFDFILYVSMDGQLEELRSLHSICRQEKKVFVPALFLKQAGIVGPLVCPDSEVSWESAIRRLHRSAVEKVPQPHAYSSTACALLANVIVFQLFKWVAGLIHMEQVRQFFLLDLETLEGQWHSFLLHPLVDGDGGELKMVQNFRQGDKKNERMLSVFFDQITSPTSGIFHIWDQGNLTQLPLAQCRIQTADPISEGPADLLPEMICNGLTHEEARREAGLRGIEAYVSRYTSIQSIPEFKEGIGVGAGETLAEGVCRGLQHYLEAVQEKKLLNQKTRIFKVQLNAVEDERCRFYLQALKTLQNTIAIRLGEEVFGFPVMWVYANGQWYGSVGLNHTLALRKALQEALLKVQNQFAVNLPLKQTLEVSSEQETKKLVLPSCEEQEEWEALLESALQIIQKNNKKLLVWDLAVNELFLKEGLDGVYGVLLQEHPQRGTIH